MKRCTVYISTSLLASSQPVLVLSVVLSSRLRISFDKDNAGRIAGMLDEVRGIEAGSRLADLLRLLNPGTELNSVDNEDVLDVSITYLRRVLLLSFYNGCTFASDVENVVSFSHPARPIHLHLRLKGADEILTKAAEDRRNGHSVAIMEDGETTPSDAETDMLVKCLNDSIVRALEKVQEMAQRGHSCLIDDKTDAAVRKIETAEQASRQEWSIGMPMQSIFPSADNFHCPSISLEQNGRHPPGEESHPHPCGRLAGEGCTGPQPLITIGNVCFAPVQVVAGIAIWSADEVQEQFPICADKCVDC
jgi:hypothetical protein